MEKQINPTIDPALNLFRDQDMPTLEAVYGPGLVYVDPKTAEVKMGFAESLESQDNGKTWTLKLKPGLKFSDDTPFDAEAVAFTIARAADPATASPLEASAKQLSTKVIDPTTLEITSNPGNAQFPTVMAENFAFVVSPTAVKAAGKDFGAHPVGPGPFKVKSFEYGISWTFERNPNYESFAPGQPYLDQIRVVFAQSTDNHLSAIQTGQGDTWRPVNGQQIEQSKQIGLTIGDYPQEAMGYLTLNTTVPPFNDVRARKALYLALDRQGVVDVWLPGNSTVTNLFPEGTTNYNQQYDFPKPDAAEAQRLFDELAAEGKPVKFTVLWPVSTVGDVGAYIHGALSKFKNVTVVEKAVPHTEFNKDQASGNFQLTSGTLASIVPGSFNNFKTGGSVNWGKWSDPAVDKALEEVQGSTDQAAQKKAWDAMQQEFVSQLPVIPIWRGNYGYAYDPNKIGGVTLTRNGQAPLWGEMFRKSN